MKIEPYTIERAQQEFEAAGVVTIVNGDGNGVAVYEDDDDAFDNYTGNGSCDEYGFFIVSFDFEGQCYFNGKVLT